MSEQLLKRIDHKLSHLLSKPVKQPETWVKSTVIAKMTGWNPEGMRAARKYGYVKYKNENGFWYLLESLNPQFIKK